MSGKNSGTVSHGTVDRTSPLVFQVKDLVLNPGTMRELKERVAAPAELGTAMIGVQENSDLDLDLRLEAVHEGILVSGTVFAELAGECGRCLEPIADDLEVDLQELFYKNASEVEGADEEEIFEVVDDFIDLEPVVRDAIVTALPFQPVCREDCAGLCSQCGIRLDDEPGHHHEVLDPRWQALAGLAGTPNHGGDTNDADEPLNDEKEKR
ncbi:DUF177 domain-containing protein [Neomicrococcus lactis]|uniref:DUF177 domain-containing protein n=2 Tax=Neomicrococcus lactis TaxID=732241 RepID=A0A7W9DAJ2_9MICC|nr:DUF177 domain-containing protein [Neomicrococcus lactis]MBB5597514.1 uncharacterized protein [Neomicrococcus lactis]